MWFIFVVLWAQLLLVYEMFKVLFKSDWNRSVWNRFLKKKNNLKICLKMGKMQWEKSGKCVSPKMWDPWSVNGPLVWSLRVNVWHTREGSGIANAWNTLVHTRECVRYVILISRLWRKTHAVCSFENNDEIINFMLCSKQLLKTMRNHIVACHTGFIRNFTDDYNHCWYIKYIDMNGI